MSHFEIALIATAVSFVFGMVWRESTFWWAMFVCGAFFSSIFYSVGTL